MAEVLGAILDRYAVADVSVQDPPLEQVDRPGLRGGPKPAMTPPDAAAIDRPPPRPVADRRRRRGPLATPEVSRRSSAPRSSSGWPTAATSSSARSSGSCRWSRRSCSGRRSTQGSGQTRARAGSRYREMIAYLLLTQHQPDVLEHAGPGRRDRPRHPRGDAQALPDPAGRHDRLPALVPGRAQGGVHRHVGPALRAPLLPLPAATSTGSPTR